MYVLTRSYASDQNPDLGEPLLPNRSAEAELSSRTKCEAALDELQSPLDGHITADGEQQMKMIGRRLVSGHAIKACRCRRTKEPASAAAYPKDWIRCDRRHFEEKF
jgi:hypothetical protein